MQVRGNKKSEQRGTPTDQGIFIKSYLLTPKCTPFSLSLWVGFLLKIHWRT